jgi:hypothetical protein
MSSLFEPDEKMDIVEKVGPLQVNKAESSSLTHPLLQRLHRS